MGCWCFQSNNNAADAPMFSMYWYLEYCVKSVLCVSEKSNPLCTGCPVCLVLKQGAVNQIFLEVFLMFLACLDHKWWAQFHLGILGPQE